VGVCAEEMACLLKLDRRSATFAKLLHLYELCIVTRTEVMAMVRDAFESDDDFDLFRDIIELRESERRKAINLFKPLNDLDFTHSLRATPSYVEIPWSYPICCAGKAQSPIARAVLNDKWVSVPVGSEHNFSIRVKNTYEDLLLKSEDERYELDLYTVRLRKSAELMKKIATEPMSDEAAHKAVATVVSMGAIQAIYKNGQREQKE
jgi:histone deacetylase complex regulatory component SIN3